MNFLTYGDSTAPTVMLIHGMATTAEICYASIAKKLSRNYHVILAKLDGHDPDFDSVFISLEDSCRKIEHYAKQHYSGHLYALSGFSLGGSIAVELLQRGNIQIDKVHLDAAFCVKFGILKPFYTALFTYGIRYMQSGRTIPAFITDSVFGKGNRSVQEMLFYQIKSESIRNCCGDIYSFTLCDSLRNATSEIVFWMGEHEPYPRKTARLLRQYLPQMQVKVFKGMGHGQLLHEHPRFYCRELLKVLKGAQ
ncbi:MAG: alpha/beta hydrolase [Oscillospiraceae bacterium]|nr:alpha/beta hydrolase [Oscillospiraceae bacterium]